jgi:hypothetical protein
VAGILGWIVHSGVVQGVIIGATLAFLTAVVVMNLVLRRITRTVDGWASIPACGRPENGVLVRAACAKALPGVNVFEEAAYWTTTRDAAGHRLDGTKTYVLRFPAGQLPPNAAFWSLTATDTVGYMVAGSTDRHSVDDRSGLTPSADGSVEVVLQATPPPGHEQNWLPIPNGRFKLMLRAYLPGPAVIDGTYHVPPVVEASVA